MSLTVGLKSRPDAMRRNFPSSLKEGALASYQPSLTSNFLAPSRP